MGMRRGGGLIVALVASVALLAVPATASAAPKLTVSDVTVEEPADDVSVPATFTVKLSKKATKTARFDYETEDGTAESDGDYTHVADSGAIKKGKKKTTVAVEVKPDDLDEEDETFDLKLSNPKRAKIKDGTGLGTINDTDEPPPSLESLTVPACVVVGGISQGTVTLTGPAVGGDVTITLSAEPNVTVPPEVFVPAGQQSVPFDITGAAPGQADVTASLGVVVLTESVTVNPVDQPCPLPPHLVINEVDYDQVVNPDSTEFIEIYNPTDDPVSLANLAVVGINGTGLSPHEEYNRWNLAAAGETLPAGGYLVICNEFLPVPAGALTVIDPLGTNFIQNGAPDGLALVNTSSTTLIDALSYEGAVNDAEITGFPGTYDLVEDGTATTAVDNGVGALDRIPNGADTNNPAVDWAASTNLTPGAGNIGN